MNTPTPECDADTFLARRVVDGEYHGLHDAITLLLGDSLERQRNQALQELATAKERITFLCRDWADDDTRIKDIAKSHGIDVDAEGVEDGYFRTCLDVAEKMSALLTEKDAQIVALREALLFVRVFDNKQPGTKGWIKTDEALSAPPPPVVPLADVKPLLTAIENTRHWHDTSYNPATNQTEGVIVSADSFWALKEALAAFIAKHPTL